MSKGSWTTIGLLCLALLIVDLSAQNECTQAQNTYWTGYRCACKVGYKN